MTDTHRGLERTRPAVLDPMTSWGSAEHARATLSAVQVVVTALIADAGDRGLTHDEVIDLYAAYSARFPKAAPRRSPQAIRTAVARAVQLGFVRDSSRRRPSAMNNPATVWHVPQTKTTAVQLELPAAD